jgi:transcriptional accessory protein Tex/SPT6
MKQADVYLKQAVSLARFQQDPLNEVLNLWSFELMDNQALQLNLHPLQKRINQQKLVDALEETNVKVINKVGVDLNLAINHDHMHILFSFLCALGPRKAKRFILLVKVQGKPIIMRS